MAASPGVDQAASSGLLVTPEIAILKTIKQKGYAGVAMVAYWADTGELIASSGPFVNVTHREDFWFFGFGPRITGDIRRRRNKQRLPSIHRHARTRPTSSAAPLTHGP